MWFGVIFAAYTVEQYFLSFYLIDKMKLPQAIPAVFLFIAATLLFSISLKTVSFILKQPKFYTLLQRKLESCIRLYKWASNSLLKIERGFGF